MSEKPRFSLDELEAQENGLMVQLYSLSEKQEKLKNQLTQVRAMKVGAMALSQQEPKGT